MQRNSKADKPDEPASEISQPVYMPQGPNIQTTFFVKVTAQESFDEEQKQRKVS